MSPHRVWPRFSILTLLLLTAVVAMAITIALFWSEVGPLRLRVARLQAEMGQLHVSDAERPQAIAVETNEPLTWRWRVYLPPLPRGKYHFNFFEGWREPFTSENLTVLLDGLRRSSPTHEYWRDNPVSLGGELTIEAKLVNRDGHWFLQVPPFGEKRLAVSDQWKDLGISPQWKDGSELTDKANALAGLSTERPMIFGRGDVVPLLLLQGPASPMPARQLPNNLPPPLASPTLMLWIDSTAN